MKIEADDNIDLLAKYDDYWQPIGSLTAPNVAFKIGGNNIIYGRKWIKCPFCTSLLTDADRNAQVQIFKTGKRKKRICDNRIQYKKCIACKEIVGVKTG